MPTSKLVNTSDILSPSLLGQLQTKLRGLQFREKCLQIGVGSPFATCS